MPQAHIKKKVLITGHAGSIGTVLRESYLKEKYDFSFLDKKKMDGVTSFLADISSDDISPAFKGINTVVHLAADPREDTPFESVLKNNILGTERVFEAARNANIKKIIFASSVRATDMYLLSKMPKGTEGNWWDLWEKFGTKPPKIITPKDPANPYNHYGISKVYGENLGRYYSERYGLSVICLRIGGFGREKPANYFLKSVWISHRDAIDGFDKSIETKNIKFGIYYLISNNKTNVYDISSTIKDLKYAPKDNSD
ncbi:MAG: SDR family oxidoreductase [Nanoarchaeota archaeon]|nr:SDR family oxidoreductase [Nanoarchaeota archaeon]MBU4451557.1 SDR family oxidoreductase [Nanoarchaeota archaeon]MCG2724488.1 SDR family oxidoreductase [archaeon]